MVDPRRSTLAACFMEEVHIKLIETKRFTVEDFIILKDTFEACGCHKACPPVAQGRPAECSCISFFSGSYRRFKDPRYLKLTSEVRSMCLPRSALLHDTCVFAEKAATGTQMV